MDDTNGLNTPIDSRPRELFIVLKKRYQSFFSDKKLVWSAVFALILLVTSLVINFYAGTYANESASNPVTDIILSNIPVYDVDGTFIYGPLVFWLFISLILLSNPKKMPFTAKSIALFVLIRSVFITLTHIGPFPTRIEINPASFITDFTFGADLFFSAHTGLPFLMSLTFWDNKLLRILFFCTAVFFGIIVLIAHLHYSIDVLSAFFITYTIYNIAKIFFKKDFSAFKSD
ncbi:MAG: phosphatase PAP2-related protein [Candidatus Paceibacterota bacterium]